jgi:MYXO-CTERM domain-containing protein
MSSPPSGRSSRLLGVVACSAITFAAPAFAGIVGSQAVLTAQIPGQPDQSSSFLVSQLLPEFYSSSPLPDGGWGAYSIDVSETTLTLTADFGGASGFSFIEGLVFRLAFLPTVQVDSFSLGSVSSGIANLDASDLSFSGNELVINASQLAFSETGASFTLNFTTSTVPGPAGLVALSGLAAAPMRRRRG